MNKTRASVHLLQVNKGLTSIEITKDCVCQLTFKDVYLDMML